MEKTDNLWIQLFPEKTIPEQALQNLQKNIMTEILSHPIDFAAVALLARRRRWGLLFAGSWLGVGIGALLLLWFQERAVAGFISGSLSYLSLLWQNIALNPFQFFASWPGAWAEALASKFRLLFSLRSPLEFLWQEYSWQLTGLAVLAVLLTGGTGARRRIIEDDH